jgi:Holliday junction DNA helicase RuvA
VIASLRGTLAGKEGGLCVVEAGGVGYLVQVSSHTAAALPERDEPVFLHTHQVVREDALMLFGFAELQERRLFELLITVSGIGPKVALAVLSGLKPPSLARAIRDENIAVLVAIPGVGRKTAERLVVELRDRLDVLAAAGASASPTGPEPATGVLPRSERYEDAVAALVHLGYSASQAQEAVRRVSGGEDERSLEDLVRRALARLGKAAVTTVARESR